MKKKDEELNNVKAELEIWKKKEMKMKKIKASKEKEKALEQKALFF